MYIHHSACTICLLQLYEGTAHNRADKARKLLSLGVCGGDCCGESLGAFKSASQSVVVLVLNHSPHHFRCHHRALPAIAVPVQQQHHSLA